MQNLKIEQTKHTPLVDFNFEQASLKLEGKSYPENTFEFYEPVLVWIKQIVEFTDKKFELNFNISYYNSSSSKVLFDIFDLLDQASKNNFQVTIKWYFNDENEVIKEAGQDFIEDFPDMDIQLIETND